MIVAGNPLCLPNSPEANTLRPIALAECETWHSRLETRKRKDGRTEWIPPPHLDSGQSRINDYHHPENYLVNEKDDEADDE
jgi:hypothetical protein